MPRKLLAWLLWKKVAGKVGWLVWLPAALYKAQAPCAAIHWGVYHPDAKQRDVAGGNVWLV